MLFYADEDFSFPIVLILRALGHDVVTVQEDGLASSPDPVVLARAHSLGRVLLTFNRWDFEKLHRRGDDHSGIISLRRDTDVPGMAARIDSATASRTPGRWCLRINRPQQP